MLWVTSWIRSAGSTPTATPYMALTAPSSRPKSDCSTRELMGEYEASRREDPHRARGVGDVRTCEGNARQEQARIAAAHQNASQTLEHRGGRPPRPRSEEHTSEL